MADALSGLVAALFATIHIWAGRIRFLGARPRSAWLSAAAGTSVAYVFLHLLPELGAVQQETRLERIPFDAEVYAAALLGLCTFHGLERLAIRSRRKERAQAGADRTAAPVFVLHLAFFAVYNLLIGYLLVHGARDKLALYALALGLHFIVNDHGLREHHKQRYDAVGRWILAAAVFGGWWLALRVEMPTLLVHLLVAGVAGAVIINVMKEELPEDRESRFWPFLAGAASYGAILLLL